MDCIPQEMYTSYKRAIVKAIDDALGEIFGKNIKNLLYAHLREFKNLDKKNYEDNLEALIASIEDFFGLKAAILIEGQVIKRLIERPGFENINKNISLMALINRLNGVNTKRYQK